MTTTIAKPQFKGQDLMLKLKSLEKLADKGDYCADYELDELLTFIDDNHRIVSDKMSDIHQECGYSKPTWKVFAEALASV
jgi:hypothetical protein